MPEVVNRQVGAILDRSCQDCHSNGTNWPWYSHVAPVSWIVSKHVSEGREMLDFSAWTDQSRAESERMLICDAVSSGSMPLASYTMIHRKARLSKLDVKLICDWAHATSAPSKWTPVSVTVGKLVAVEISPLHSESLLERESPGFQELFGMRRFRRTLQA